LKYSRTSVLSSTCRHDDDSEADDDDTPLRLLVAIGAKPEAPPTNKKLRTAALVNFRVAILRGRFEIIIIFCRLVDCLCSVGSLAIPLAQMGAKISASDISDSMADEASRRAEELGIKDAKFYTSDLESVTGTYDTVTCVDVAIHYPSDQMAEMVGHLCSLSSDRVIFSFAPKTWYYSALKKFGELFPGPSKTTRAYLHEEQVVRDALTKAGFQVAREEMTGTNFYFSRLLEAKRI